jgi:hypothetical protein
MQDMQQSTVTTRGFLQDLEPNDTVKAWAVTTLQERNSSGGISRADVLRGIREEEERKRALTQPLDIVEMPTLYLPAISTAEQIAQALVGVGESSIPFRDEEEEDPCVEIVATADCYTLALIHDAVERLGSTPTLIVVSVLRWLVDGKLLKRWQYHYHGVRVPIVPSDGPCKFDVKVYGCKM